MNAETSAPKPEHHKIKNVYRGGRASRRHVGIAHTSPSTGWCQQSTGSASSAR